MRPHELHNELLMIATSVAELAKIWAHLFDLGMGFDMDDENAVSIDEAREKLGGASQWFQKLKWDDLSAQASRLLTRAEAGERGKHMTELSTDLREAIEGRFHKTQICIVEGCDFLLFKGAAKHLCGNTVIDKLPSSAEEVNLAGRALALGLSTASVSHSMRSVEASLQALAKDLGVSFTAPIELQEWLNLTEKISSEIKAQEKQTKSQQKTDRLKRLSELLIPADCFRLAWRNHVAHARERYEEGAARAILQYTGEYLAKLAEVL